MKHYKIFLTTFAYFINSGLNTSSQTLARLPFFRQGWRVARTDCFVSEQSFWTAAKFRELLKYSPYGESRPQRPAFFMRAFFMRATSAKMCAGWPPE
jgi:hypothetical protein